MPSVVELNKAVKDGEFRVYYQPRFSARNQTPEMVEALLRWDKKYPIDQVVLKLEQNGLIQDVTLMVVASVCSHMRKLKETIGCSPKVAINMSPLLFADPWFMQEVQKVIQQNGVPPPMIEFEITESRFSHDIESVGRIAIELRQEGFGIGLDDFGVGFSGLKYLDSIPASALKIDRHFIDGLGRREKCDAIVASVAKLAYDAGMIAVAEGIETEAQLRTVKNMGYDELQGFLLAKPMSFADLAAFLKQFTHGCPGESNVVQLHNRVITNCL